MAGFSVGRIGQQQQQQHEQHEDRRHFTRHSPAPAGSSPASHPSVNIRNAHSASRCGHLVPSVVVQMRRMSTRAHSSSSSASSAPMAYTAVESGSPYSDKYRVFIKNAEGKVISPFHDIPLYANAEKTILNVIIEVPRWSNAKMEIDTKSPLNPIKQDVKNGKLRFVKNCFPHHGYIWNYGAFPQTWEDPHHVTPETGAKGDNDPLDVCEIGEAVATRGQVKQVKVLGIMALLDEGETDWKILAIDVNDPLAEKLNDVEDIEKHMPKFIEATNNWFKIYKIPDGKPANQFAFEGKAKNSAYAHKIIEETHGFWNKLVNKTADGGALSCVNTTVAGSPFTVSEAEAEKIFAAQPAAGPANALPEGVDKWYYPNA
ncbi:inorganic pyrophosphatase [Capsaspora owczarzaki ATCC 30864]|nr:inorganic pyrophosphatase [Capsaspora owczarzaki ATCC 30864]|eukprot:XP_004365653.2 inorganic pyrophosphatase [Capsaspora owczarzaki ATCC 30864]